MNENGIATNKGPFELFSSGSEDEARELAAILDAFTDVNVVIAQEARLLRGRVPMPYLLSPDGSRVTGIENIRRFIEDHSSRSIA